MLTVLNIFQISQHSVTCVGYYKICTRNHGFPEISKIYQTLKSCISENSEYFFKIRKDPERSMSELSYEPNTIKNGHLAQKLGSMKGRRFSENPLSQPHTVGRYPFARMWIDQAISGVWYR